MCFIIKLFSHNFNFFYLERSILFNLKRKSVFFLTRQIKCIIFFSETANIFYKIVQEKKEAGTLTDAAVQRELVKEAERLGIRDKAVLILSELVFTENILAEINQHRTLLLRFCGGEDNKKAQKYLLGAFEKLVGDVYHDKLFNSSMSILKKFYDEDILDEEVILEWSLKESKKYVSKEMSKKIHEKCAAFIKWLREAEEESDEEDEDEDDDEEEEENENRSESSESETVTKPAGGKQQPAAANPTPVSTAASTRRVDEDEDDDDMFEFSHRVSGIQVKTVVSTAASKPQPVNATAAAEPGEDDIDIDDI